MQNNSVWDDSAGTPNQSFSLRRLSPMATESGVCPLYEVKIKICLKCGEKFEEINEENIYEDKCSTCQAAMRIAHANNMHETGSFQSHMKPLKHLRGMWGG